MRSARDCVLYEECVSVCDVTMTSYGDVFNATLYDDDFPLLMPRWGYVASAFVLFLIGFFGFFLNLMVILLMFKDRQLWTPLNIILFNLVCSDFSVSVLGNPLTLVSALFHRWIFGKTMCVLYGFFMALLGITSITTLTVISFERYLMVTRPLSSRHLSCKGAIISVFFIWTYSLALTTPPLLGWGNYVNEAANISCSVNWHEQSTNTLTYILFLFALGQIVPSAVITFSYVNIIRTMKRNSKRLGRVNRAEARATTMVFIMIVAFTVAWTPYSVFALMEQFATEGIISPGAGVIPALVAKSSICYDPLIYVGMNTQFRQAIKRVFGIHSRERSSQGDKKYNNTITSPAHRHTSLNDFTTKFNSENSTTNKKKLIFNDDNFGTKNKMTTRPCPRNIELCTIQENRASDPERSGDTIYDEDSSNSRKLYDESFKINNERSPVLTIIDSERITFNKYPKRTEVDDMLANIYGNEGFEEHATDVTEAGILKPRLRHSFSLDLTRSVNENKAKVPITIESKLETPQTLMFKDTVVTKFLDKGLRKDNYKSCLYDCDNSEADFV